MKGKVGRQKGERQTPLMQLASERNWDKARLSGAHKTIIEIAKSCRVQEDDVLYSLIHGLFIRLYFERDSKWEKDKEIIRRVQDGASKTKEAARLKSEEFFVHPYTRREP